MAQAHDLTHGSRAAMRQIGTSAFEAAQAYEEPVEQVGPISAPLATAAPAYRKLIGLLPSERKLIQALVDWLIVAGGFTAVTLASERHYDVAGIGFSLTVITALWFFFASAFDTYTAISLDNGFRSAYNAAKLFLMTDLVFTLAATFVGGVAPLLKLRVSEMLLLLLLIAPLVLVRLVTSKALNQTALRRHVVIVGANRSGREMAEAIKKYGGSLYEFVGYFDDNPTNDFQDDEGDERLVHRSFELLSAHHQLKIDQIILANPTKTPGLLRTLSICHERGVQITPMFALYQDLTGRVPVGHVGQDWYVALPAHVKPTIRTYMAIKRGIDILLAFVMLACVSPLLPLIALAIRLDSPGPIFFKQIRTGRGGRQFKIVKFRSMKQDAEALVGAVWAIRGDPRITRVGVFLRRSRLDEIPQLWNVLVGDMSFVGPRPERPELEDKLEREVPFYRARRAVQPGLTGWAQVSHGYGNTMFDALRKVEYDLYYIKNESPYLDLLILLRTVAVVLKLGGT